MFDIVSLQTGLLFTRKGYTEKPIGINPQGIISVEGQSKDSYNYIELPVSAAFKLKKFQIYAGPYIAIGISGKSKNEYTIITSTNVSESSGTVNYKSKFGEIKIDNNNNEPEYYFRALDYGINLGIGYQLGPILINTGFSLGLGNMTPKYEGSDVHKDIKERNRVANLSVTYFFGK